MAPRAPWSFVPQSVNRIEASCTDRGNHSAHQLGKRKLQRGHNHRSGRNDPINIRGFGVRSNGALERKASQRRRHKITQRNGSHTARCGNGQRLSQKLNQDAGQHCREREDFPDDLGRHRMIIRHHCCPARICLAGRRLPYHHRGHRLVHAECAARMVSGTLEVERDPKQATRSARLYAERSVRYLAPVGAMNAAVSEHLHRRLADLAGVPHVSGDR